MHKSGENTPKLRPDIANFPKAQMPGTALGHDGTLTDIEVAHLQSLGYDVMHYKAATGPRLVEAYLEGAAKGLIEFNEKIFKALESMRKHYAKTSREGFEESLINKGGKVDALKLLEGLGSDSAPAEQAPKKRGRPPKEKL